MDVGECNGLRLYTGLTLDYRLKLDNRLRLWAPISALHAISAVALFYFQYCKLTTYVFFRVIADF